MIVWLCAKEFWNSKGAIVVGTAARNRRATAGSSHDNVHPDNSTLHTETVRPNTSFLESPIFIPPRTGHFLKYF
jgi:hypothetical protein